MAHPTENASTFQERLAAEKPEIQASPRRNTAAGALNRGVSHMIGHGPVEFGARITVGASQVAGVVHHQGKREVLTLSSHCPTAHEQDKCPPKHTQIGR